MLGFDLFAHSTHTSSGLAHRFLQGPRTRPTEPRQVTKSPTFIDHLYLARPECHGLTKQSIPVGRTLTVKTIHILNLRDERHNAIIFYLY
jgi:hypothetical protein